MSAGRTYPMPRRSPGRGKKGAFRLKVEALEFAEAVTVSCPDRDEHKRLTAIVRLVRVATGREFKTELRDGQLTIWRVK